MKQFSSRKEHTFILTQLLVPLIFFAFSFLWGALPVHAQTGTLGQDQMTSNPANCQYSYVSRPGGVYQCTDANGQITTAQQAGSQQTAAQAVPPAIDPTAGCSNGINTGLGCIPYETQGFTAALLGFLASTSGAIALIIMLIATIQIMTGGDNAEQVKKGKELFTGAIVGLFFIIFSVTLLRIIAGDIIKLPGFGG